MQSSLSRNCATAVISGRSGFSPNALQSCYLINAYSNDCTAFTVLGASEVSRTNIVSTMGTLLLKYSSFLKILCVNTPYFYTVFNFTKHFLYVVMSLVLVKKFDFRDFVLQLLYYFKCLITYIYFLSYLNRNYLCIFYRLLLLMYIFCLVAYFYHLYFINCKQKTVVYSACVRFLFECSLFYLK